MFKVTRRSAALWISVVFFLCTSKPLYADEYVNALALVNDVLLWMGDGYGDEAALKKRLGSAHTYTPPRGLTATKLYSELNQAMELQKKQGDVPWESARPIASSVRGVILEAEKTGAASIALTQEFLLTQYLYMSYYGNFELAPELSNSLVSKSEKALLRIISESLTVQLSRSKISAWRCVDELGNKVSADSEKVKITPLVFQKCLRKLKP